MDDDDESRFVPPPAIEETVCEVCGAVVRRLAVHALWHAGRGESA